MAGYGSLWQFLSRCRLAITIKLLPCRKLSLYGWTIQSVLVQVHYIREQQAIVVTGAEHAICTASFCSTQLLSFWPCLLIIKSHFSKQVFALLQPLLKCPINCPHVRHTLTSAIVTISVIEIHTSLLAADQHWIIQYWTLNPKKEMAAWANAKLCPGSGQLGHFIRNCKHPEAVAQTFVPAGSEG